MSPPALSEPDPSPQATELTALSELFQVPQSLRLSQPQRPLLLLFQALLVLPSLVLLQQVTPKVYSASSRFEYVPYQKKVMDYEIREYTEMVPKERVVTEFQERRYTETVPREVVSTDYYAVEHIKQYVPTVVPEVSVETIPVERTVQRTEYVPVEKYIRFVIQENSPLSTGRNCYNNCYVNYHRTRTRLRSHRLHRIYGWRNGHWLHWSWLHWSWIYWCWIYWCWIWCNWRNLLNQYDIRIRSTSRRSNYGYQHLRNRIWRSRIRWKHWSRNECWKRNGWHGSRCRHVRLQCQLRYWLRR